ncbi:DUF922 domain-containing protein [Cognatitamlana onchidii]|uniref:DUF922 domain-containing protein n=1 Tax=Cognatitamlana onchidii TaxID=2562860 RepID=UPI001F16DEC4|nr:DUF922 domain-containing protein [Algibacter onchidii]
MIRLLCFISCLCCLQDEPFIPWEASNKLDWNDFKAPPNTRERAAALTASGIAFGFSLTKTENGDILDFTSTVQAHFYPEQSWYRIGLADTHVLKHEQLHFDITELFARKLRQRINTLKVSNSIEFELKKVHDSILEAWSRFQDVYDESTDYSRDMESQNKWEADVQGALKKLDKFKL